MAKKKKSVADQLNEMFDELGGFVDDAIDSWNRFHEKGVKKGAKDARKLCNDIRKKAAEIRKKYKELEL